MMFIGALYALILFVSFKFSFTGVTKGTQPLQVRCC